MTTEATPGSLGSNDGLGLEQERAAFVRWYKQQPKRGAGAMSHGPAWAAWQAATRAERERCAKKPLTAQQLDKLIEAHVGGAELADGEYSAMVLFAAAVERAHGIRA